MDKRKNKQTRGDGEKEIVATDGIAAIRTKRLMVINLGYELKGTIERDELGGVYVEGEISTPRWKQSLEVSSEITSIIEAANKLEAGAIKKLKRMAYLGNNRLVAQVTLAVSEDHPSCSTLCGGCIGMGLLVHGHQTSALIG